MEEVTPSLFFCPNGGGVLVKIIKVEPHSPCAGKVHVGDSLVAVDGHEIHDVLDYMYYSTPTSLRLTVKDGAGRTKLMRIRKEEYGDLGLEFVNFLMDHLKSCHNKCIFCFIDQLPPGMRETLYFKDDDSRMSFLRGNYITLTNLSDEDLQRMAQMKISPLNISVHATQPELRVQMMKNPKAGRLMEQLKLFAQAGITLNCQIVLCRGVNDGENLDRTLRDLLSLEPQIGSIAVVPAGLTKYREGLHPLQNFTPEEAAKVIEQIDAFGEVNEKKTGLRMVYPADEFFLKAGLPIPEEEYYGEFAQLENGVGMLSLLRGEIRRELDSLLPSSKKRTATIATGVAAYPFICQFVDCLREKWHNLNCKVVRVENEFFGREITVTGLVTGKDLIRALDREGVQGELLISSSMLRYENDRFLDDVTVEEVEKRYGVPLIPVNNLGRDFVDAVLGRVPAEKRG